jgi:dipeptidyl aminopeptidase/acylaminoacyl peptidase
VSKDDPPLLLAHGEKDDLVPFDQSVRMAEAYRGVGLSVEFIAVKNAGHDFEQVGMLLFRLQWKSSIRRRLTSSSVSCCARRRDSDSLRHF